MDSLPNEMICHIGSFLSAKEAAFIMVLSKKWRNLFTIIQKLHFDGDARGSVSFDDFVDGVLALPVTSRISNFSLRLKHSQYDRINRCVCNVLKRGVLKLKIRVGDQGGYSLPLEVFTCKTISKMKLGPGFAINLLPADAFLPALKTLFLDSVVFCDFGGRCAFKTLLSASPVLEELVMDGIEWERWKWSSTVSSPTLQRLTIRRMDFGSPDDNIGLDCRGLAYDFDSISLDTPALTYLDYSDYVPKEYPIVNLGSLVGAELHLRADRAGDWNNTHANDFDPTNLINGLKNVEILEVSPAAADMLYIFREAIPLFEKLVHISMSFSDCWHCLPVIIEKSPNLETLIIFGELHYSMREDEEDFVCPCLSDYSFLLSCHLKILEIATYEGTILELEQLKHFLGKLPCLERVVVNAQVTDEEKLEVMVDLRKLPRASSKCKVEVVFAYRG